MENEKVLVTGATGNVGLEVIRGLSDLGSKQIIVAGSHLIENARKALSAYPVAEFRELDFNDASTFIPALEGIDVVFLVRPPHLADVKKYFYPFIRAMKQKNVDKVVFLSVQGAESQKYIPHNKIEKLIVNEKLEYVFLRPGYFMQNLTTTLVHEIKTRHRIVLPSGNLKFNWVDARDVGLAGAFILNDFEKYKNNAFEITGSEFTGFREVAALLSRVLGKSIRYESPNLLQFVLSKKKQGIPFPMIMVMIMLHFLPRLGKNQPRLFSSFAEITGRQPGTLLQFAEREKKRLM